jgi:hypothetical protein
MAWMGARTEGGESRRSRVVRSRRRLGCAEKTRVLWDDIDKSTLIYRLTLAREAGMHTGLNPINQNVIQSIPIFTCITSLPNSLRHSFIFS